MNIICLLFLLVSFTPFALIYGVLGMYSNSHNWRKYFICIISVVFVVAYNYNPVGHPDLTRYFVQIETAKQYDFMQYNNWMGDSLFVKNLFFWAVGKLQMPKLVPAITTTIVYGCSFYITCDFAEREGLINIIFETIVLQFCLLPFVFIVNNVRNVAAFALISLAVYRDLVQKKKNIVTLLLYILPCFLHKTGFVAILIRVLSLYIGRYLFVLLFVAAMLPTIVRYLFKYYLFFAKFGPVGILISKSILTAYRATISTSDWAITSMNSRVSITTKYIDYIICVLLIVIVLLLNKESNLKSRNYLNYVKSVAVITIATNIFRTPVYWRFFALAIISAGPAILIATAKAFSKEKYFRIIYLLLIAFAMAFFGINIYGSRVNIDYIDLVTSFMLNPFVFIIAKFFYNIILI